MATDCTSVDQGVAFSSSSSSRINDTFFPEAATAVLVEADGNEVALVGVDKYNLTTLTTNNSYYPILLGWPDVAVNQIDDVKYLRPIVPYFSLTTGIRRFIYLDEKFYIDDRNHKRPLESVKLVQGSGLKHLFRRSSRGTHPRRCAIVNTPQLIHLLEDFLLGSRMYLKALILILYYIYFEKNDGGDSLMQPSNLALYYDLWLNTSTAKDTYAAAAYELDVASDQQCRHFLDFLVQVIYSADGHLKHYPQTCWKMVADFSRVMNFFHTNIQSFAKVQSDITRDVVVVPGITYSLWAGQIEIQKRLKGNHFFDEPVDFKRGWLSGYKRLLEDCVQESNEKLFKKQLKTITAMCELTTKLKRPTGCYEFESNKDDVKNLGPVDSTYVNNKLGGYEKLLDLAFGTGMQTYKMVGPGWYYNYMSTNKKFKISPIDEPLSEAMSVKNYDQLMEDKFLDASRFESFNLWKQYSFKHEILNPSMHFHKLILDIDLHGTEPVKLFNASMVNRKMFHVTFKKLVFEAADIMHLPRDEEKDTVICYYTLRNLRAQKLGLRCVVNFFRFSFYDSDAAVTFINVLELIRLKDKLWSSFEPFGEIFDKGVYSPGHALRCCGAFKYVDGEAQEPLLPLWHEDLTNRELKVLFIPEEHLFHSARSKAKEGILYLVCVSAAKVFADKKKILSSSVKEVSTNSALRDFLAIKDYPDFSVLNNLLSDIKVPSQYKQDMLQNARFEQIGEMTYRWMGSSQKFHCCPHKVHKAPQSPVTFELVIQKQEDYTWYGLKAFCFGRECRTKSKDILAYYKVFHRQQ